MNLNQSGIYSITSKDGKCYIGSSKCFRTRWNIHKNALRKNKHHSIYMQNYYNKYPNEELKFHILTLCEIQDLIRLEQAWIDMLSPEFNMCQFAGSTLNKKDTEETKKKKSLSMTGLKKSAEHKINIGKAHIGHHRNIGQKRSEEFKQNRSGENNYTAISIICIEKNTAFPTISSANNWLRSNGHPLASSSAICAACRGRLKTAYGYHWQYADNKV